jgi:hypothetical protein
MKTFTGLITSLLPNQIFVFGSNPEGRHGGGTARIANQHYGAELGNGRGIQGQSYALVTKNLTPNFTEYPTGITYVEAGERSVSKKQILFNILELYLYATKHPDKEFLIAYTTGPNLNGYTPKEMADMFTFFPVPENIVFNDELIKLSDEYQKRIKEEATE